ncbi:MAG TPA: nitrophenyl compound nitroreductase subunit ArsF family protein [Paludibacter sp.]
MKKHISIIILAVIISSFFSANSQTPKATKLISKPSKVEVYYFHYTRRCVTCQAVETETKKSILALYPLQTKKGLITFTSINLDEKSSEAIAAKCKAEGQSLLITSSNKRVDLTDKAFMYAKSSPLRLKAELKKTIDPLF